MRDVRLGSQLYINKTDTPEQVSAWVRQMHEAGLRVIRLFMVPARTARGRVGLF